MAKSPKGNRPTDSGAPEARNPTENALVRIAKVAWHAMRGFVAAIGSILRFVSRPLRWVGLYRCVTWIYLLLTLVVVLWLGTKGAPEALRGTLFKALDDGQSFSLSWWESASIALSVLLTGIIYLGLCFRKKIPVPVAILLGVVGSAIVYKLIQLLQRIATDAELPPEVVPKYLFGVAVVFAFIDVLLLFLYWHKKEHWEVALPSKHSLLIVNLPVAIFFACAFWFASHPPVGETQMRVFLEGAHAAIMITGNTVLAVLTFTHSKKCACKDCIYAFTRNGAVCTNMVRG